MWPVLHLLLQVKSGAKRAAISRKNDASNGRIIFETLDRARQLHEHLVIQGVKRLGAIQSNRSNAPPG